MPFLFVEKSGIACVDAQGRQERVLVRERVPAERREVEDESLWRDACPVSGWSDGGDSLIYRAAEELGDAASVLERLALDTSRETVSNLSYSPSADNGAKLSWPCREQPRFRSTTA